VGALFAGVKLVQLDANIASALHARGILAVMQTLTEDAFVGDRQITVTTTRGTDETLADFIARHHAAVAALSG